MREILTYGAERGIKNLTIGGLKDVYSTVIADEVFYELDSLEVEDVWDQSGSTRYGYVDPNEKAWEMLEDAIELKRGIRLAPVMLQ